MASKLIEDLCIRAEAAYDAAVKAAGQDVVELQRTITDLQERLRIAEQVVAPKADQSSGFIPAIIGVGMGFAAGRATA